MLTHPVSSPPPVATNLDPATPQSPSRSSRLRRLTYLRSYTQQHLSSSSSRSSRPGISRSISYPDREATPDRSSPGPEGGRLEQGSEAAAETQTTPPARPNSSWLPTVGNLSGTSRPAQPQRASDSPSVPADSTSQTNTESLDPDSMARRRGPSTRPPRNSPADPSPGYNSEAMRFARLDGAPNLDSPNPDIGHTDLSPQTTTDAGMPALARESSQSKLPTITFLPHQDPRSSRPSLTFAPVTRTLKYESSVIRVGRYSERETIIHSGPNEVDAAPVGFKSKVVSRKHCEFWCASGKWYLKDVKSSSGTFLNHIRLSPANQESKPFQVNDGDVIQLGIDFRGGEEQIFRCVKIKIESNRTWQKKLNQFNVQTHKRLRNLGKSEPKEEDGSSGQSTECVICLMSIAPCQSLFVAPCSHVWHYKCIRPMLESKSYPCFSCPNCRAITDLEADVDVPEDDGETWDDAEEPSDSNSIDQNGDTAMGNGNQDSTNDTGAIGNSFVEDLPEEARVMTDMPTTLESSATAQSSAHDGPKSNGAASTLISRRQASNVSLPRDGSGAVTAIGMPTPTTPVNTRNRSTTLADGDEANHDDRTRLRSPTPQSSEQVTADGLLTPTNNAGPFVFDGSAGRAPDTGRRLTASVIDLTGLSE